MRTDLRKWVVSGVLLLSFVTHPSIAAEQTYSYSPALYKVLKSLMLVVAHSEFIQEDAADPAGAKENQCITALFNRTDLLDAVLAHTAPNAHIASIESQLNSPEGLPIVDGFVRLQTDTQLLTESDAIDSKLSDLLTQLSEFLGNRQFDALMNFFNDLDLQKAGGSSERIEQLANELPECRDVLERHNGDPKIGR